MLFDYFLAGNSKGIFVKIFAEIVARGNSVQIGPNFPAKSLNIYIRKKFLDPFLIGLIEITYLIKENVKEKPFVAYWVRDNKEIKAYSLFLLKCLPRADDNNTTWE